MSKAVRTIVKIQKYTLPTLQDLHWLFTIMPLTSRGKSKILWWVRLLYFFDHMTTLVWTVFSKFQMIIIFFCIYLNSIDSFHLKVLSQNSPSPESLLILLMDYLEWQFLQNVTAVTTPTVKAKEFSFSTVWLQGKKMQFHLMLSTIRITGLAMLTRNRTLLKWLVTGECKLQVSLNFTVKIGKHRYIFFYFSWSNGSIWQLVLCSHESDCNRLLGLFNTIQSRQHQDNFKRRQNFAICKWR